MKSRLFPILFLAALTACTATRPAELPTERTPVRTGAEQLIREHRADLDGKTVGLVMNPTARIRGTHMLDTLRALGVTVGALFAPEHGFRGDYGAGEKIADGVDAATGIPVFSLYGQNRKPNADMLRGIDILIFDMQDVGARFYTYVSTMGLVMEAAAENGIPIWILDRPNPAGGDYVSGWMLQPEHTSFVGAYPVPVAHGMTLGEIARMIVGEKWLKDGVQPELRVIPMAGWNRSMRWADTGLPWVAPSPNLPSADHAWVYLGTCFFEGSDMSEGRGTEDSFLLVGDPTAYVPKSVREDLQTRFGFPLQPVLFTPIDMPNRAMDPKHENDVVRGWRVTPAYAPELDPVAFGLTAFKAFYRNADAQLREGFLKRLAGTDAVMEYLMAPGLDSPAPLWQAEVEAFKARRAPYLLYD